MHRRWVCRRAHRLVHGVHGRFAQWRCGIIIKIERRHRHHWRGLVYVAQLVDLPRRGVDFAVDFLAADETAALAN